MRSESIDTKVASSLISLAAGHVLLLLAHVVPGQEGVLQRLDEVEVLHPALRTRHCLTVVREEVESLLRMDDQLTTRIALKIFLVGNKSHLLAELTLSLSAQQGTAAKMS